MEVADKNFDFYGSLKSAMKFYSEQFIKAKSNRQKLKVIEKLEKEYL